VVGIKEMRVILLRPPRYLWPFNSETSAFWQPLGLLSLAAAVRKELTDVKIEVWDAPGQKWGWQTLTDKLADGKIDVLGVGEEAVSAHEALRAAGLAKQLHPGCLVVAGGVYFAHTIEQTLKVDPVDIVVRGEGERTFVELLANIDDRKTWPGIDGLAFLNDAGQVETTPPRKLIGNLDSLPLPAYDLVNMASYGHRSHNHPGLVSVEHSRGCIDNCSFCILWKHMGKSPDGNGQVVPHYRTKSAERSFEEVRWLYHHFGRRTFGWVDPTFNASPKWSDKWAELMLGSELVGPGQSTKTLHTAWVRADCIVRDEQEGILDKLVRAGLRQVMIGVERDDQAGLATVSKHNNSLDVCREAFAILRENYPQVYTIGTVIFGLPEDGREDIDRLMRRQYELGMDYCFLIPLTPCPGTEMAEKLHAGGYVVNGDLASYNFHTPVCRTDTLSLRELESVYWRIMLRPSKGQLARGIRQLLLQRDGRRRRIHLALLGKGVGIAVRSLARRILHPNDTKATLHSRRPPWYDK